MTTQQKLFNRWMEQNYQRLLREMPQRDMLHSAYITVFCYRQRIIPTPERFERKMTDAYYRHILREFNHTMHFTLPDPLFWLYQDEELSEEGQTEDSADQSTSSSRADLSNYQLARVFAFVKQRFSQEAFIIFRLAVAEQRSVQEIAQIVGLKKATVSRVLGNIEEAIKKDFRPVKKNK